MSTRRLLASGLLSIIQAMASNHVVSVCNTPAKSCSPFSLLSACYWVSYTLQVWAQTEATATLSPPVSSLTIAIALAILLPATTSSLPCLSPPNSSHGSGLNTLSLSSSSGSPLPYKLTWPSCCTMSKGSRHGVVQQPHCCIQQQQEWWWEVQQWWEYVLNLYHIYCSGQGCGALSCSQ